MIRGEVWWVNFDLSIGSEIKKKRPAIIVSNNVSNKFLSRVQVIPLTSNTENLYPSEAIVTIKGKKSKALADQVMTVDKKRLKDKIALLPAKEMEKVDAILILQLNLSH